MSQDPNGQASLRHPLKQARGLGSAKGGTDHFVIQRITSVALVFLSIYFVGFVLSLVGAEYVEIRAAVANPWHATLLVAFVIATFWHTKLGFQVIIEDYVHTALGGFALQLLNTFVCVLAAIASVLAIIRIALGA
ncbi:succinate dehydrogenase, hydrophobic membrane anchor protein [Lysobacter korlensis]|uniref:Succinate dehydrogenase hydrophobic membrane anchor subunit n=1 Tax=Lysobacter korlensis TaxID=553636 RepID=A0ABV6RL52_9GAMM